MKNAAIHEETGEYMFVASPGAAWQYGWFYLDFDYPSDPDTSLRSNIQQWERCYYPNRADGVPVPDSQPELPIRQL